MNLDSRAIHVNKNAACRVLCHEGSPMVENVSAGTNGYRYFFSSVFDLQFFHP